MTMPAPWWLDTRMLDAGDARRINPTPLASQRQAISPPDLRGNLNAAADRLGVDVADLVRLRRELGIAPAHRAPGLLARLAARLTRKG